MSIENHPNLHAVGFLTDIHESLEQRIRGRAGEAGYREVLPLVSDMVAAFVDDIDMRLDQRYGPPPQVQRMHEIKRS